MRRVVVFDCETNSRPVVVNERGEKSFDWVQVTCSCALEFFVAESDLSRVCSSTLSSAGRVPDLSSTLLDSAKWLVSWRDVSSQAQGPFHDLFALFDRADVIVGFNALDFDFPALRKHYGTLKTDGSQRYFGHRFKCVDIFERIRSATGYWPSLDSLLLANGLESKSGSGAAAIELWNEGRRDELESYCKKDVQLTAELSLLPSLKMKHFTIPGHVFGCIPSLVSICAGEAGLCPAQH